MQMVMHRPWADCLFCANARTCCLTLMRSTCTNTDKYSPGHHAGPLESTLPLQHVQSSRTFYMQISFCIASTYAHPYCADIYLDTHSMQHGRETTIFLSSRIAGLLHILISFRLPTIDEGAACPLRLTLLNPPQPDT